MLSLVDIDNHKVANIQIDPKQSVWDLSLEDNSEAVDRGPHKIILIHVALVAHEPLVQGGRVLVDSNTGKADRCSRHQRTNLADSVSRCPELLILPLRIALVVLWVVSGAQQRDQQEQARNLEHDYKTINKEI